MNVRPRIPGFVSAFPKRLFRHTKSAFLTAAAVLGGLLPALSADTIGGGTISSPAVGPAPSYGLGGPNAVLVKNWDFGTSGTIKSNADLSANFYYHDQFNTISNKYGAKIVSPDAANALPGQPIEGVNSPTIREYTSGSLKTYLTALNGATSVNPVTQKAGSGSFMSKFALPNGGALLGMDIVWETRVRMKVPPYYWFAIWTAGNAWNQGAEHDVVEGFGFDNGGGNTNYDGRYWHSNTVRGSDQVGYTNWDVGMASVGITNFNAEDWHTWTWVYRADNSYAMYMDGILVQYGQTPYFWTLGTRETGVPINMSFLFDGSWGHTEIASVNKTLDASELAGKYYEWDYSRVYLVPLTQAPEIPTGLTVDAGHEEVLLNWTLASRATSYNVYRGLQSDGSDAVLVASGVRNVVYTDKGLVNDTTYYYKVSGVNQIGESGQSAIIAATPILTYTVDDADTARIAYTGDWTASTSTAGYYATGYHHDANTGAVGGKRAVLTPTLLGSGIYKIYTRVPAGANRASNAPFDINHASGTTTIPVNEQINSNQWVLLGEFPLNAGSSGNVTVRNDGGNGFVMVDAMRWVPVSINAPSSAPSAPTGLTIATTGTNQLTLKWNLNTDPAAEAAEYRIFRSSTHNDTNPTQIGEVSNVLSYTDSTVQNGGLYYYTVVAANTIGASPRSLEVGARVAGEVGPIVDDVDPNVTFTGTWTESSFEPGSYGNLYHVAAVGDGKYASYQPDLPANGRYEIFMRWTAGTSRANNAPVDVYGSGGNLLATVAVNQTLNNNTWVSIGKYDFSAGTGSSIRLRNDGTTATVISDAAKWVLQTAPGTIALSNLVQIYDGNPKTPSYTTSPGGMNAWISYNGSTTEPVAPGRYAIVANIFDPNYTGSATGTLLIALQPTAAPDAPQGLTATAGLKQATVSWAAATNPTAQAFEYRIYRSTTHLDPSPTLIATVGTELTYTDLNLQGGTVYYYTIVAANTVGTSPRSWEVGAAPSSDVATVIVDDPAAAYTGAWTLSVSQSGYYGTGYRHDANTGTTGGKRAKFTPNLPQAGTYAVYTRAPSGTNRASNAPFDINHSSGTTTVAVNEQLNNNEWVLLGKYIFAAGTAGNVTVRNDAANGFVMVDAIRWISSSLDATITLGNLSHTYDGTPKEAIYTTSPSGLTAWVSYNGSTTPPTAAGSYTVVATLTDPNYVGTATGTLVIEPAAQALDISNPGPQELTSGPITLPASSSAGLPITYSVLSGPATVSGNQATITGAGTIVIRATQSGNGNYAPASDVDLTFQVAQGAATVTLGNLAQRYDGTPKSVTATTNPAGVNVVLTYDGNAAAPIYPGDHAVVATISDQNYSGPAANGTLVISTTALVRHAATLNAGLDGSLQQLLPENTALNSSSMVSRDLLVPGNPGIQLNGGPLYGGTVEGPGSTVPSNYTVTINSGAVIPHVVRRIDPLALPTVAAPAAPAGTRNVSLNAPTPGYGDAATLRNLTLNSSAGSHALPAGTYGAVTINGTSELVLGVAGATEPSVYAFQSLTVNTSGSSGGLKVVGPVVITLANGTQFQSIAGSSGHPEWLALKIASGGLTLNTGAEFHGSVVAPNGTVTLNNATLHGTVAADRLVLNGTGLLVDPEL